MELWNGKKVKIKEFSGTPQLKCGIVRGLATIPIVVMGRGVIVEVESNLIPNYPYNMVVIAEIHLEELT